MEILGIDVGGSGIKGAPVNVTTGALTSDRFRLKTPKGAAPDAVAGAIVEIVKHFNWKGPIGIGFPAPIKHGIVKLAANISPAWIGINADDFLTKATGCDERTVYLDSGKAINTGMIIWTAGIAGNRSEGIDPDCINRNGRINVDSYNNVTGYSNVFAIGDISLQLTDIKYPRGHPQVAQVAIQQAQLLAENLCRMKTNKHLKEFKYKDLGTMATVGRHLAVVELPSFRFQGIFAWFIWMFVHLMSIIGVKNKSQIFLNWAWKYFTYDQSTRLILRPKGCADISSNYYNVSED